jgi:protein-S-isoprenylcysteine O-methyltransferase Ste14
MIYGIAILFVVPITLITWASSATVQMPVYGKPYIGYTVFGFGVIITLLGMGELLFRGRGLPTTLSTTIRFADVGAYSAMPHPIYTGVCIAVWGMSMAVQSASGLWLITPMVVIASVATVYGV